MDERPAGGCGVQPRGAHVDPLDEVDDDLDLHDLAEEPPHHVGQLHERLVVRRKHRRVGAPRLARGDALDARDRFSTIGSASFRHGKNAQFEGGACNVTMTTTSNGEVTTWYADGTKIKSKNI